MYTCRIDSEWYICNTTWIQQKHTNIYWSCSTDYLGTGSCLEYQTTKESLHLSLHLTYTLKNLPSSLLSSSLFSLHLVQFYRYIFLFSFNTCQFSHFFEKLWVKFIFQAVTSPPTPYLTSLSRLKTFIKPWFSNAPAICVTCTYIRVQVLDGST